MIALSNAPVNPSVANAPTKSRAFLRGFYEASEGLDFDPSHWGYARGSDSEYEYAQGYASECSVSAAIAIIEAHDAEAFASILVGRVVYYEPDGNILRHGAPR